MIAQAREICAVAAPTFAEGSRAELVARLMAAEGLAPERDEVGNVIGRVGGEGAAAVFAAHLDTVFDGATEIAFREADGRLAAPGIGDNALGVAALLHLARHLREHPPHLPVALVATVGEEGLGDLRGAKALLEALPCRAFVAVEGQGLDGIVVGAVASVRLRARVRGPGGHPWGDRGAPSAVHALVHALSAALEQVAGSDVVLNVGVLGGGTVINAIASEAHAELDLRAVDAEALRALEEVVLDALERAGADQPALEVEVETVGRRPGGAVAADDPLLLAAREARVRAGLPEADESASSTDANAALGRGIPAVTVGVTTGGNAHRLDEYIDLEPIAGGLAALAVLLDTLAGDEPAAGA